jgi:hypothetical protein
MKRVRSKCVCVPGAPSAIDGCNTSTRRRNLCPNHNPSVFLPRNIAPPTYLSPQSSVNSLQLQCQPSKPNVQLIENEVVMPGYKEKIADAYTYLLEILQYAFGAIHDLAGFFQSKNSKTDITFGKLHEYLKTVPGILSCMHMRLTNQFQYPVESITLLLEGLQEFVLDPDIADASIGDFNDFAKCSNKMPPVPVQHGVTWIEELLCQFKRFVGELWVIRKKIPYLCMFGAKSDNMYLCMECMTEHY